MQSPKTVLRFTLAERKRVLVKYVEQPEPDGAFAGGSPRPIIGDLYLRPVPGALNIPQKLILTLEKDNA